MMKRATFALALGTGLFVMAASLAAMAKTDQQALDNTFLPSGWEKRSGVGTQTTAGL